MTKNIFLANDNNEHSCQQCEWELNMLDFLLRKEMDALPLNHSHVDVMAAKSRAIAETEIRRKRVWGCVMSVPANDKHLWDLWEAARRAVEHHASVADAASKLLMDIALEAFRKEFANE